MKRIQILLIFSTLLLGSFSSGCSRDRERTTNPIFVPPPPPEMEIENLGNGTFFLSATPAPQENEAEFWNETIQEFVDKNPELRILGIREITTSEKSIRIITTELRECIVP